MAYASSSTHSNGHADAIPLNENPARYLSHGFFRNDGPDLRTPDYSFGIQALWRSEVNGLQYPSSGLRRSSPLAGTCLHSGFQRSTLFNPGMDGKQKER